MLLLFGVVLALYALTMFAEGGVKLVAPETDDSIVASLESTLIGAPWPRVTP